MTLILRTTFKMVVDSIPELKLFRKFSLKNTFSYEDAIAALNSLQSNASVLQQSKSRAHNESCLNLDETRKYMFRCGISMSKLNLLSVIHVAGTKGKGTTCALSESILRSHGYRTGFFSSPHLTCVTERIRLCGKPINRDVFVHHFETVYKTLESKMEYENDMPPYFKFLTILAYKIFICENVDVAIIEVGIGGEHDCTNVLRNVSTVGITSLGLEHTAILGNTIEKIAWQKAGIMKPGCQAFTVPQKYPNAMKVLQKRAEENKISLTVVPAIESYRFLDKLDLHLETEAQKLNLSLAIQLSNHWMQRHHSEIKINYLTPQRDSTNIILELDKVFLRGINKLLWPGRYQITNWGPLRIYLDGAHTIESLETCVKWFTTKSSLHSSPKILIFNATGDRNSSLLLKQLALHCNFDAAIFVPNAACPDSVVRNDQNNYIMPLNMQMERCYEHRNVWYEIIKQLSKDDATNQQKETENLTKTTSPDSDDVSCDEEYKIKIANKKTVVDNKLCSGNTESQKYSSLSCDNNKILNNKYDAIIKSNNLNKIHCYENKECHVFDSVYTALEFSLKRFGTCDILVTGSLHLVGATIVALESNPATS